MEDLVIVRIFGDILEAEIAKGYLETNGVKSIIRSDDAGGMIPSLEASNGGVLLLVRKVDHEKASLLLKTQFVA